MGKKRTSSASRDQQGFRASDVIDDASNGGPVRAGRDEDDADDNIGSILLDVVKDADVNRLRAMNGSGASPAECLLTVMNWMHKWQQEYQVVMVSLTHYMDALHSNLEDNEALEDNTEEIKEMEDEAVVVVRGFEKIALALLRLDDGRAAVNITDEMGWTLLMQAANCGSVGFVQSLVDEFGADVAARQHADALGMHALARAIDAGHMDVLGRLCTPETINASFSYKSQDVVVDEADAAEDVEFHTPLSLACRGGHEDMVDYFLAHAAIDVNRPLPESGDTALHIAMCFDMDAIVHKLLRHAPTIVNARNAQGYTAAFGCSNADLVGVLLSHGLDAHVEGFQGETLLDMALALGDEDVAAVVQAHVEQDDQGSSNQNQ
ncbi:Aste57867_226 [Aphanomyces stellatus]|uniref:Aste57867_226 protein n=1 Tax=Aphanomyces stellatus TaxID=120398 RepID=A0A485K397_9STRA|nr:hypothetical protein As57867_000226 [Aphanomyces stellatus]VFT77452.1 Aste57867_226 [Aphanomyces stellatus]